MILKSRGDGNVIRVKSRGGSVIRVKPDLATKAEGLLIHILSFDQISLPLGKVIYILTSLIIYLSCAYPYTLILSGLYFGRRIQSISGSLSIDSTVQIFL